MSQNINDISRIQELKKVFSEKNVSANSISTIEKALNNGMVFKKPEDLAILNVPALDLNIIKGLVDFGTTTVVVSNLKTIQYTFKPIGEERFFYGYQLVVTYINKNGFAIEQSYQIEDTRIVIFDLDLNDISTGSKVTIKVKSAQGKNVAIELSTGNNIPRLEVIEINAVALVSAILNVQVDALLQMPNPPIKDSYQIKGKLISNREEAKLDGYQIVIFASIGSLSDGNPDFSPAAFARTESNGYFVTSFLMFNDPDNINHVNAGKVSITKDSFKAEFPITLVKITEGTGDSITTKSSLPGRLILVISEDIQIDAGCKDCGCNELNFLEKKVLEEFSYYSVVRTTEPSIIADVLEDEKEINLNDIYGVNISVPFSVFQKFHTIESRQINPANFILAVKPLTIAGTLAATGETARTLSSADLPATVKPGFNQALLDKLVIENKVKTIIKGNSKPVFKGRTHLSQLNQIDWDDQPTIYQAASIAHGHILHFKQEWIADGYSIGDLLYSLPLAPGQKKQIAVLDWERRESAANSQTLDYEETLNNSLARDRDINEIVSGTLTENIRGNSKASTEGIGFGMGSSVMGIIPGVGSFGSLMGISGGASSSGSNASQSSNRDTTAQSLQTINDRTNQAASVVRSQRSTVIQTVSQGERVQATSESVANYNHCHAITIQYFEVLRHFAVRNRLAGVQECLFVPLQMTQFDIEKCLRWRNTLEKHLYRRELRPAFGALARIHNEKESPFENYYDSIGFPRKNYAEQNINFYSGELYLEFYFFNTSEKKIDQAIIDFYSFFRISLDDYKDKNITDEELANVVGPRAIEYLIDTFVLETDKGTDLKLDLTLLTAFRQNASLHISIRQSSGTSVSIARDLIDAVNIKLDLSKLSPNEADSLKNFQNKYMKIKVTSGNLRYRSDNFSGELFSGRLNNDIFAEGDGVYIPTPLTKEELRNPRGEDVEAANNLIHHLNENLEYYNKCIFFDMTPERRFMLLDGIIAPGKANGRSVASVVENRIIGIAGNSLIMPVSSGNQLDPTIDETFDLFAQYYQDEQEPMRVSMPTKGVYAESVMGKCNSCEQKDESRFWRWEESPIPDSPTTPILPLNTDTRRADPGNLQPKDFPSPIVNIQNAPAAPDPTGLQNLMTLLGKGDSFRDLTGLNQNQLNALATFQKSLDTAQSFGKEAADLAKAAASMKMVQDAQNSGTISSEQANDQAGKVLDGVTNPQDPNVNKLNQGLNALDKLQKDGKIDANDASTAKSGLIKNFLDSSSAKTTMSNDEIKGLSSSARSNNTDINVTRPGGEQVNVIPKGAAVGDIIDTVEDPEANIQGLVFKRKIQRQGDLPRGAGSSAKIRTIVITYPITNTNPDTAIFAIQEIGKFIKKPGGDDLFMGKTTPEIKMKPGQQQTFTLTIEMDPDEVDFIALSNSGIFNFREGDPDAKINPANTLYLFPFPANTDVKCTQSFATLPGGANNPTHTGTQAFAVDFDISRGTSVFAARDGIVVHVKDSDPDHSNPPNPALTEADKLKGNSIRLLHPDGTYTLYGHLLQGGAKVKEKDSVKAGITQLALSGNSGFSPNGDHLHFAVEKSDGAGNFVTLEFRFNDSNGNPVIPEENKIYKRI